jgi:hypothetical protein
VLSGTDTIAIRIESPRCRCPQTGVSVVTVAGIGDVEVLRRQTGSLRAERVPEAVQIVVRRPETGGREVEAGIRIIAQVIAVVVDAIIADLNPSRMGLGVGVIAVRSLGREALGLSTGQPTVRTAWAAVAVRVCVEVPAPPSGLVEINIRIVDVVVTVIIDAIADLGAAGMNGSQPVITVIPPQGPGDVAITICITERLAVRVITVDEPIRVVVDVIGTVLVTVRLAVVVRAVDPAVAVIVTPVVTDLSTRLVDTVRVVAVDESIRVVVPPITAGLGTHRTVAVVVEAVDQIITIVVAAVGAVLTALTEAVDVFAVQCAIAVVVPAVITDLSAETVAVRVCAVHEPVAIVVSLVEAGLRTLTHAVRIGTVDPAITVIICPVVTDLYRPLELWHGAANR